MFIFPLVLLLASISTPAVAWKPFRLYDIRIDNGYICDNVSRWPNSRTTLLSDGKACSGTETLFIDHQQNQSTVTRNTVSSPPNGAVCVRLVDLSVLSHVFESPNGPCDQLQAKSSSVIDPKEFEKLKKGFTDLVLQINDASNVLFIEEKLGSVKSHIITDLIEEKNHKPGNMSVSSVERIGAVSDYLAKTKGVSEPFARRLDQAIAKSFPGTNATIEGAWIKALAFARDMARDVTAKPTSSSAGPSSSVGPTPSSAKPSSSAAVHSQSINPSFSATPSPSGPTPSSKAAPSSNPAPLSGVNTPPSSVRPNPAPEPSANLVSSNQEPSSNAEPSSDPEPSSSDDPSSGPDPEPSTSPSPSNPAVSLSAGPSSNPAPSSSASPSSSGPVPSSSASSSSTKPASPNSGPPTPLVPGIPNEYVIPASDPPTPRLPKRGNTSPIIS